MAHWLDRRDPHNIGNMDWLRRPGRRGTLALVLPQALALALSFAACGGGDFPSDRTWESAHFVYKTRAAEADACPDILVALEEHFAVMQATLGFSWPAGQKVTYHKFVDQADLRANSDCGAAVGCVDGTSVQTATAFDGHELVHAYLAPTGFPPWMLLEGTAVALACQLPAYPRPTLSWRQAFGADRMGGDLRGAGAWLAGFLLRSRPVASFLGLYGGTGHPASAEAFAGRFEEIYGASLDDSWTMVTALDQPPVICPWECSRPSIPLDGSTPVSPVMGCGMGSGQTFELTEEAEVVATLTGRAAFGLGGCGDGSLPPTSFWTSSDGGTSFGVYRLAAGRYFLGGPAQGATLTLARFPAETWVRSTCALTSSPPPWMNLVGGLYLALPRGTWHVPMSWQTERMVLVYPSLTAAAPAVLVCPGCDPTAAACQPASTAAPFASSLVGASILHVTSTPAAGGSDLSQVTVSGR